MPRRNMEETLQQAFLGNRALGAESPERSQETAWVLASQRGDSLAFNRLVLKWEKSIYNLALRMLQNTDEASEATQDVFLSAYQNIRRFRLDAQFSTWLYRIAANHCISMLRRRPPGVHYSLDDHREDNAVAQGLIQRQSHEEEVMLQESRHRVRQALEHLNPNQKAIVELKFFQELTFEQIAVITETPLSTIKSRFYASLEQLRVRLGSEKR